MPVSDHVYCVAVVLKNDSRAMNRHQILHWAWTFLWGNNSEDLEGGGDGQLVIGSFIMTMCPLRHHISCRDFWRNVQSHWCLRPLQPRFSALWLLAFAKTKITFEREEISDRQWDTGNYDGAADGDWENCVKSLGTYFDGDWGIIVLWMMFLVSCNFFNKCLYFSQYMTG